MDRNPRSPLILDMPTITSHVLVDRVPTMVEILLIAVAPIEDIITPTSFPKPIFSFLEAILLHFSTFDDYCRLILSPTFFLPSLTKMELNRKAQHAHKQQ